MRQHRGPMGMAWVVAALGVLAAHSLAQGETAGPSRYRTQVATNGPTFWVYTIDTTTGRASFLDRRRDGVWEWIDSGTAPSGPGPVGTYQLLTFANDKGAHVYVSDTRTSALWSIDEAKAQWLSRGGPTQASHEEAGGDASAADAAAPGRFSTQVVADGPTFWVYTIDTTTGRVSFLDRERDGVWEWIDDGAAPTGPGPVGKYQLVPFANDKGAHVYVCDTTTGDLWSIDEESLQWLPRSTPRREPPQGPKG